MVCANPTINARWRISTMLAVPSVRHSAAPPTPRKRSCSPKTSSRLILSAARFERCSLQQALLGLPLCCASIRSTEHLGGRVAAPVDGDKVSKVLGKKAAPLFSSIRPGLEQPSSASTTSSRSDAGASLRICESPVQGAPSLRLYHSAVGEPGLSFRWLGSTLTSRQGSSVSPSREVSSYANHCLSCGLRW